MHKHEASVICAFSYFDDIAILRVRKRICPVKNKEGEDSPKTALSFYLNVINEVIV